MQWQTEIIHQQRKNTQGYRKFARSTLEVHLLLGLGVKTHF